MRFGSRFEYGQWARAPSGQSSVTITMDFQVKGGALGRLFAVGVMRPMMQRMFKRVLGGLDLHVRTGASIGKDGKPVVQSKGHALVAAT